MRIAEVADNPALTALTEVLRIRNRAYGMLDTPDAGEIKRVSDAGHRAILAGIAGRDPVAAAGAAAAHVAQTEIWLRKNRPRPHS
jgi:DNA-binding FadR family transcriptional regulator